MISCNDAIRFAISQLDDAYRQCVERYTREIAHEPHAKQMLESYLLLIEEDRIEKIAEIVFEIERFCSETQVRH